MYRNKMHVQLFFLSNAEYLQGLFTSWQNLLYVNFLYLNNIHITLYSNDVFNLLNKCMVLPIFFFFGLNILGIRFDLKNI